MIKSEHSENNIASVQMLRGIAAFMVTVHHAFRDYLPMTNVVRQIIERGWMGVEVFFIISGFIIPYSMFKKDYEVSDFKVFFHKRLVRIEPPYIISMLLLLLFNGITTIIGRAHGVGYHVDWWNVLGHLGYINAFTDQPWLNMAYWTLALEFEFYLLLALMYPIITHRNKAILLATMALLLATAFVKLPTRHFFQFSPFFMMGMALFLLKTGKMSKIEFALTIAAAVTIIYFKFYFKHDVLLISICLATLACIHYIKKVPKIFLFLGTISYSLYLTHGLVHSRIMAIFDRFMNGTPISIQLTVVALGCIAFAYLFYLAFEKPAQALSRKIHYRRKTEPQVNKEVLAVEEVGSM